MGEAHGRAAWARTSSLMALIANCHRDPKKGRAFKPSDFDPYTQHERERIVSRGAGRVAGHKLKVADIKHLFDRRGRGQYKDRVAEAMKTRQEKQRKDTPDGG